MAVSAEPSIDPVPLAVSMEVMSAAAAVPVSVELKLVGSVSRSARA